MTEKTANRSIISALLGRTFLNPVFDYLIIGGGLSLIVTVIICYLESFRSMATLQVASMFGMDFGDAPVESYAYLVFPFVLLFCNGAHFSASIVRLYTKPDCYRGLPFMTMAFPLICLGVLTLCIWQPSNLGTHLRALFLTWSPYHFAAQAYGLGVMYCYRSGCILESGDKKLMWWVAMMPCLYSVIGGDKFGLGWVLSPSLIGINTWETTFVQQTVLATWWLGLILPVILFALVWRHNRSPMPLISLMVIYANTIWYFFLPPIQAFIYANIFHSLQYLAIVVIFHVKEQTARADNRHGILYHALWFYGVCALLAYGLFRTLPQAYVWAGFGLVESTMLVVAAVNIHHFAVDGYIWRLGKKDTNRKIIEVAQPSMT